MKTKFQGSILCLGRLYILYSNKFQRTGIVEKRPGMPRYLRWIQKQAILSAIDGSHLNFSGMIWQTIVFLIKKRRETAIYLLLWLVPTLAGVIILLSPLGPSNSYNNLRRDYCWWASYSNHASVPPNKTLRVASVHTPFFAISPSSAACCNYTNCCTLQQINALPLAFHVIFSVGIGMRVEHLSFLLIRDSTNLPRQSLDKAFN